MLNLADELQKHYEEMQNYAKLEDPRARKYYIDGLKAHIALECFCESSRDQLENAVVKDLLKKIGDV